MKKRIGLILILTSFLVTIFSACNSKLDQNNSQEDRISPQPSIPSEAAVTPGTEADTQDNTVNVTASPSLTPVKDELTEAIFKDKGEDYRKMIEKALLSEGNNYRVKKAIEKAQKGEEVTIAYIGGSITEGAGATVKEKCYAYQAYLYFKETFGKDGGDNVKFVNAGMGGTPSTLGVIRYNRDVTSYGQVQPDIVFIEFSVNDYQEPTKGAAYESMIRDILNAPNQPAVIQIFSVFKSRWNMQDVYIPLGYFYDIPMISIRNAVVPELEAGRITDDQFFYDEFHPKDFGHGIMADCIKYYFTTVNAETQAEQDITVPDAARIGQNFTGIKFVDSKTADDNVKVTPGSFNGTDTQLVRFATGQFSFPNNWKHTSAGGNDGFTMTVNCKNMLFVYKSNGSGSFGTAQVYVDGKLNTTLDSTQGGGWNNPMTVLLFNEQTAAEHTIEVKMADGSENKEFTIMAVGYTQ